MQVTDQQSRQADPNVKKLVKSRSATITGHTVYLGDRDQLLLSHSGATPDGVMRRQTHLGSGERFR
jgi:hypothetical protein